MKKLYKGEKALEIFLSNYSYFAAPIYLPCSPCGIQMNPSILIIPLEQINRKA
jgi:hypothetical protein